jgi:hypothetical protein
VAIIPFLEDKVHGDKNFIKDIKRIGAMGRDTFAFGRGLTDEALRQLNSLDEDFSSQIEKGGLPDYVLRDFEVAQGRLSDDYSRSGKAFTASLQQQAKQSGGRLSPEAIAAMMKENESDLGESFFNARNDLSSKQAGMRLQHTDYLFDQIRQIREKKLGTAQAELDRGQAAQIASILARLDRNKAIASTITSMFGASAGAGFTGGGR